MKLPSLPVTAVRTILIEATKEKDELWSSH
jgi:hypothetical protein